jgi:hypothetical protein
MKPVVVGVLVGIEVLGAGYLFGVSVAAVLLVYALLLALAVLRERVKAKP